MGLGERFRRRVLGAALVLGLGLSARPALAFCRTTTCDARTERCVKDAAGCVRSGRPLAWPDRCLSFATQKDGSPKSHISYALADSVFRAAFQSWTSADCGGGRRPSFRVWDMGDSSMGVGGVECDVPEYNKSLPNANVWMFRDDEWPYDDENATLAMTTVQFEKSTGVILDADVEVNSFSARLSANDVNVRGDLQSIATHEAGHFLGLSHSANAKATMYARYTPGSLDIRRLDPDDQQGICAAYPPDRDAPACSGPSLSHGFSRACGNEPDEVKPPRGCAVAPAPMAPEGSSAPALLGLLVLAGAVAWQRRVRG